MAPTVAILAPGAMGSAIATRLTGNGVTVLTNLSGRSQATRDRAQSAGMKDVSIAEIANADIVLSIVPPAQVFDIARTLAPTLSDTAEKPIYVDCNAINPSTSVEVGKLVSATGTDYLDASLIGLPPTEGKPGPTLFVSGPGAQRVEVLNDYGFKVRVMEGDIGAASALKMAYGGTTKGIIAIGAAMIAGAQRNGAGRALHAEMSRSQAQVLESFSRSIPDMYSKAHRWVDEMEQISAFLPQDSAESRLYLEIAAFYKRLASDAGQGDIDLLSDFFAKT